jgi:hypothetical protein
VSSYLQRAVGLVASSSRSAALDFGWCRWIELLDPTTHFSRAATALVDPVSATAEFRAVATAFGRAQGPQHTEILARLRLLRAAIEDQPQTVGVTAPARTDFINATVWTEHLPSVQRGWNADYWKTARLRQRVRQLLNGPQMRTFEQELNDASSGFKATLLDRLGTRLGATGPLDRPAARVISRELELLAALVIGEGRDAATLADRSLEIWRAATTDADAIDALKGLLRAPRRRFVVALKVQGIRNGFPDAAAFSLRPAQSPLRWTAGPRPADRRLQEFVAEPSTPLAITLLCDVDAYDHAGAWVDGLAAVDDAVGSVVGEYRIADISVVPRGTVLDTSTGEVRATPTRARSIVRPRTMRVGAGGAAGPIAELADSLRQHARSRDEARPAWATGLAWAALDALAGGAEETDANGVKRFVSAGAFLPPRSSATVILSAVRYQLIHLWRTLRPLASRQLPGEWGELEAWITNASGQAPGGFVDLETWADLLRAVDPAAADPGALPATATVEEAAARLLSIAAAVSSFGEHMTLEAHERLTNGRLLWDWCHQLKARTTVQLQRMRFVRHSVMHTATFHIDAVGHLRQAAHDLVDAHYEVLRHWVDGNRRPWEALQAATEHFDTLMDDWRAAGAGPPPLVPDELLGGP